MVAWLEMTQWPLNWTGECLISCLMAPCIAAALVSGINTTNNHTLAVITAMSKNINSKVLCWKQISLRLCFGKLDKVSWSGCVWPVLVCIRGASGCHARAGHKIRRAQWIPEGPGIWDTGPESKIGHFGFHLGFVWLDLWLGLDIANIKLVQRKYVDPNKM